MADDLDKKEIPRKKLVNKNLISLKCLLFVFFGGLGSLYPFLPLHMELVGFTKEQIQILSMVSPMVATLGPMVAAPIADRLARRQDGNEKPSTGRHLRYMIAIACVMSGILYMALLFIPPVNRMDFSHEGIPAVKFVCDQNGASIHQERCHDVPNCDRWFDDARFGQITLSKCEYVCNVIAPTKKESSGFDDNRLEIPNNEEIEGSGDIAVKPLDEINALPQESKDLKKHRRYVPETEPPHLCYSNMTERMCHVYTPFTDNLSIQGTLLQTRPSDMDLDLCIYPIAQNFFCRIPQNLQLIMSEFNQTCSVECDLVNPYTDEESVLADSCCQHVLGLQCPLLMFYAYVTIRSIADAFATSVVALLDAAVVIATRETSCGRGDVGRQLAFGSLGFAAFGALSGYLTTLVPKEPPIYAPIGLYAVLMLIASCIATVSKGMPLSPSEGWWHTRSGMLALPMSAVKRYGNETVALMIVFVVLGIFWSVLNTYLPIYLTSLNYNELVIGVAMTAGAVPAFIILWKSENTVDYCGHSNILILAFTVYILRFTAMSIVPDPTLVLLSGLLDLFTLGMMWITAILYLRHLVPRHMTVTAQALPVIAHFCIGRSIGAVIGVYFMNGDCDDIYSTRFMYRCMAAAAAIVAILYFVIYHGVLKPRCHAQTVQGPRQPPTIVQAINGNGSYTPLRVYHNGMGRKGQFRY